MSRIALLSVDGRRVALRHGATTRICDLSAPLPSLEPSRVARSDVDIALAEENVGRALGEMVGLDALSDIVIVEPGDLTDVPWELLAPRGHGCAEAEGGLVVRRAAGPRWLREPAGHLRVLGLSSDPTDPDLVCALRVVERTATAPDELPAPDPGSLDVLVVAEHGVMERGRPCAVDRTGTMDLSTAHHLLEGSVRGRWIVVLASCHGATDVGPGGLATRLVRAGAGVVLAPRYPMRADVLAAGVDALLEALRGGRTVGAGCRAARRAVRSMRAGFIGDRWHSLVICVADESVLETRLADIDWPPSGGRPDAASAQWLELAAQCAREDAVGFLGLEHLLATLPRDAGPLAAGVGRRLATLFPSLATIRAGAWVANPAARSATLQHTPRVERVAPRLPDAFRPEDLLRALFEDDSPLTLFFGDLLRRTWDGGVSTWGGNGGAAPERRWATVLWGPEDGRRLDVLEGGSIGRWSPDGTVLHGLFAGTSDVDRAVSRCALTLAEGGWVASRAHEVHRDGRWALVPAGEPLSGVVQITPSTWVALPNHALWLG
ncbi:MAG: hypothetical protein H6734_26280 [Alphaproteobacteria bacterium]|nr:hypothetical protein [Alphaproteobacteria bacterium]